jgi:ABC-type branched-subunit amino acid transport system ATPase component/ABC-type branched-subunit amino acid transport system permease subunit
VRSAMSRPGGIASVLAALLWVAVAPDYLIFTVSCGIPLAVAALGLLVLQGWAREISLATAGLFATAMYWFGYLNRQDNVGKGIPWVLAALLTIAVIGGLMAAIASVSVRLPAIYLIVLTLGVQTTLERVVFSQGNLSGGISGGTERQEPIYNPRPWFLGLDLRSDTAFYLFLLAWLVVLLALLVRLRHSPAGLAMFLSGDDRQAASAVGISPLRYRLAAYSLSGTLAAVGGILACWLYINPPVFVDYLAPTSLLMLAIPVLAGLDSIAWVVGMAVAFQVIPVQLESWRINTFIEAGVGLLLGAALGSRGVGGRFEDLTHRVRRGNRATRTGRGDPDVQALRNSDGLAGGAPSEVGSSTARGDALAVLHQWLPPKSDHLDAIHATGIRVRLGGVLALDGATVRVPNGAMVGLIGPNGAGKTTLFDVISGNRPADEGRVELFGTDVTRILAWRRSRLGMARTFQSSRVIEELTVADNLLAGARQRIDSGTLAFLLGSKSAWARLREAEQAAWAAAVLLGIDRYWDERAGTLEFSARRRIEIARCLVSGPRLLLLDEPAAGLDPTSSTALLRLLRSLHEDLGLTVLLVEHYVKAVLDSCDIVHVLAEGAVIATGSPANIARNPVVRDRYLGTRLTYTPDPAPQPSAT